MQLLLYPLSKIYSAIMSLRELMYSKGILKSYQSKLKVISIGNISAGGTGKTPLCIYLCEKLKAKNLRPAVLSRGYKGSYKDLHRVSTNDEASLCGDEALLIHQKTGCPVVLCRDRAKGAKFIEEQGLADVIILDDAFQHLRLKRDLDIVTINSGSEEAVKDLIFNRVIPFGLLREDVKNGMHRADLFIISNRKPKSLVAENQELKNTLPANKPAINSYFEIKNVCSLNGQLSLDAPAKIVAFCAIANPESFFSSLESAGFQISERIVKSDHAFFYDQELQKISEKYNGLPLVCTEKDAVKIKNKDFKNIYQLNGKLQIDQEEVLLSKISSIVGSV